MVTTAGEVAARMNKVAEAARTSSAVAVKKAAAEMAATITAGGPKRLRNVGKKGAALGVSYTVTGGDHPTATGKATGPWQLIEYGVAPHLIGIGRLAKRTDRVNQWRKAKVTVSRSGAAMGRVLDGAGWAHPVRGPVLHPGTKGQLTFHKGVEKGTPKVARTMNTELSAALFKAFSA